jgi:hypothetical protein
MSDASQPWSQQICPFFTMALMAKQPEKSLITGPVPAQKEAEAAPCVGPVCMLFVPECDPDGKPTGDGKCCFKSQVMVTQQVAMVMAPLAQWVASKNNMKLGPPKK